MKRVYFTSWGSDHIEPAYAMHEEWQDSHAALARALARKNRLEVLTIRHEGTSNGRLVSVTTIGRANGTPVMQVWFRERDPIRRGRGGYPIS